MTNTKKGNYKMTNQTFSVSQLSHLNSVRITKSYTEACHYITRQLAGGSGYSIRVGGPGSKLPHEVCWMTLGKPLIFSLTYLTGLQGREGHIHYFDLLGVRMG